MSLASAFQFRPEACDRVRGFLGPANSSLRAHEGPSCKYLPFAENNFSLPSLIYRHIPKAGSSTAQMLLLLHSMMNGTASAPLMARLYQ